MQYDESGYSPTKRFRCGANFILVQVKINTKISNQVPYNIRAIIHLISYDSYDMT